jgi:methyl-accepting chemotaxis protein
MIKKLFDDSSAEIKAEVINELHDELKDVKDAMSVLLAKAAVDTRSNIENPVINAQLTAEYEKVSGAINKVVTTTSQVEDTVKTIVTAVQEAKEVIEEEIKAVEDKAWYE